MSNLGAYQWITTVSKKVGGLVNLLLIVGGGSIAIWEAGKGVFKKTAEYLDRKYFIRQKEYEIINDFSYFELKLSKGDKFRIVGIDRDSTLIEILNDVNNPYVIPTKYLKLYTTFERKI